MRLLKNYECEFNVIKGDPNLLVYFVFLKRNTEENNGIFTIFLAFFAVDYMIENCLVSGIAACHFL